VTDTSTRRLHQGDTDTVNALVRALGAQMLRDAGATDQDVEAWLLRRTAGETLIQLTSRDTAMYGAFDGDELVAVGGITVTDDQHGRIHTAYVTDHGHGHGHVKLLFMRGLQDAFGAGVTDFSMVISANNPRAQHIAHRFGFEVEGPYRDALLPHLEFLLLTAPIERVAHSLVVR